jgi:DNA-binding MarR family transcriptional regulator
VVTTESGARSPARPADRPTGAAFLLAQLGAHAAARFADRVGPLGFTPPQTGLIHAIAGAPGRSQQAVAEQLGMHPSRVVALVDGLERDGILERRRNPQDRRNYALYLTDAGHTALARLKGVGAEHEVDLCAALTDDERIQLAQLLRRIADQQGLAPGVHPGFRRLGDQT